MGYFARKLKYGARDGEVSSQFIALLELTRKKGGAAVAYILYRHVAGSGARTEMIRFHPDEATGVDPVDVFWPWGRDWNKKPPPWFTDDTRWVRTTRWLFKVAAGGWFGHYPDGTWVKVGTPASWKLHRKKRRLQIGNIAHIVRAQEAKLVGLVADISRRRDSDDELTTLRVEVAQTKARLTALRAEMNACSRYSS